MLKPRDYSAILRARRAGLSIRQIARRLHHCRSTVAKVLNDPIPRRYSRKKIARASAVERYHQIIIERIQCATDDLAVCLITAADMFRFLRDSHGYGGSYAQVLRYVRSRDLLRNKGKATLIRWHGGGKPDLYRDILRDLSLVPPKSAVSILEDIAHLDLAQLSERAVKKLQVQIKVAYSSECYTSTDVLAETHVSFPLFFRLLFRNEMPVQLQRAFSREELSCLQERLLSRTLRQRRKAASVILCKMGFSHRSVARTLHLSRHTVADYAGEYEKHGASDMSTYAPRMHKAEDTALREAVFGLLHSPPSSYGINRTTWTMRQLQAVLKRQDRPVCAHVLREIIRSAGYKWRKAKVVLTSSDPEYKEKLNKIKSILSSLGEEDRFFSIDEFGPFAVKMIAGRQLVAPGEYPQVPQFQKSKGSLIITAALELCTNQVTHFYSKKKNTDEMIKLLGILLEQYKGCKTLYLSWDAGSWHASKALYARVDEVNETAYRDRYHTPRVELAPLPASSQFLNVIESVFSGMARAIIHNSNYQSLEEAMRAIDRHFEERNEYFRIHPKRAGKKIWRDELVPSAFSEAHNCKDPSVVRQK